MEDMEQVNSDVQSEVSSEPQSQPESQTGGDELQALSPEQKQPDSKPLPFHEHPRWQEMIAERNAEREARQSLESKYQELERRLQGQTQQSKPTNPLTERLKKADEEFGKSYEELLNLPKEIQEFKEWKRQMEVQNLRNQAMESINKLHDENKVDPNWRDVYNSQIELAVAKNPSLKISDLPQIYKGIHESFTKRLEGLKRSTTESYVKDKKTAASVPASPGKGKPVDPAKKSEFTGDPEADRALLVSRVMNKVRNSNSL